MPENFCEVPDIFAAIHDAAQVREADRRALPVNHYQIFVVVGRKKLIAGIDWHSNLGVRNFALGLICIGALEERADLIQTHVVFGQRLRIHFDANRRQRASTHINLADALDLR